MKIYGSYRQLCFGGWILGALALLAVNGYQLLALQSQPLKSYSPIIKAMESKLARLHDQSSIRAAVSVDPHGLGAYAARFSCPKSSAPATPEDSAQGRSDRVPAQLAQTDRPDEIILPVLAGIAQVRDGRGRLYRKALLDGKICTEQERIGGFTVMQITDTTVVLMRGKRRWSIEGPAPYYSSDVGR